MRHKHYDLIKQWIENPSGYNVFCRLSWALAWGSPVEQPKWLEDSEYKLEPKPVTYRFKRYITNYNGRDMLFVLPEGYDFNPESDSEDFTRWVDTEWQEVNL